MSALESLLTTLIDTSAIGRQRITDRKEAQTALDIETELADRLSKIQAAKSTKRTLRKSKGTK